MITTNLCQQSKLYEIIIHKIYNDVTIFSQLIVHSYLRLYGVNVIIFDLQIHNTLFLNVKCLVQCTFGSNIDSFIINFPLNIY